LVAATVFALRGRSTEGSAAPDASRVIRSEIDPPPGAGGAGIPELSPDGQYLVFHALNGSIWLRALNDASSKRLTGVDDGYRACWSPDSRSVAVVAGNRLKLVAVPAGQVSTVGPAPWITTSCAWSARGEILISSILMPLVAVRVSDGTTRSLGLTNLAPGPANYAFSNFLPDRRHFVFALNAVQRPEVNGVYIGDMEDRDAPVKLLSGPSAYPPVYAGGGLTLTIRGGVLFARGLDTERHRFTGEPAPLIEGVGTTAGAGLSASANGLLVLDQQVFSESARVDVLDRKGQTIRTLDERASAFAVAPDGSRVLLAKTNGLWLTDLNRPAPIRLSGDSRSYLAASWSTDGKSVTYTRATGVGGGPALYRRSVSADDEKQVFASSGDVYARTIVPTFAGAVISLLPKRVGSSFDLMRLGTDGVLTPFVQTLDNESSAAVSADGRWVAYESDAGGQ
jgi:hypothetical protein